jgi:hypothetical protein
MGLSDYQIAGFKAKPQPVATLHGAVLCRSYVLKITRIDKNNNQNQNKLNDYQSSSGRILAQFRAKLRSPDVKLFLTTSSSTFIFMLGFLS